MKKLNLLFAALIILSSCDSNSMNTEFPRRESIEAQIFRVSHPEIFGLEKLIVDDEYIITVNRGLDSMFKFFDRRTGEYLGDFGSKGYGPNDLGELVFQTVGVENGVYTSVGLKTNELINFQMNKSKKGELSLRKKNQIQLPLRTHIINDMISFDGSTVIGMSESELIDSEFFKFNLIDSSLIETVDHPVLYDVNAILNERQKFEVYMKKLVKHPDANLFAALYTHYNLIRIFDSDLNLIHEDLIKSRVSRRPEIKSDGSVSFKNSATHYVDVTSSKNYIFGLTTGLTNQRLESMSPEQMLDINTIVRVWNWKGERIAEIDLDRPIFRIAFDEMSNLLLGISPYNESEIYKYDFSNLESYE